MQRARRRTEQFVGLVSGARDRLKAIYESGEIVQREQQAESDAVKRRAKQHVLEDLRQDYAELKAGWGGIKDYDEWFKHSLNNAQLNTLDTYYHLVPAFRQLLREQNNNLESFYRMAAALGKLKDDERQARLNRLREISP